METLWLIDLGASIDDAEVVEGVKNLPLGR